MSAFDPQALQRRRHARGLTLDSLGGRAGVSRASLIAFEKGSRRPGLHTLRAIADGLGCDVAELTGSDPGRPMFSTLRLQAGVTRSDLARRLGIGRATWDRIERGTTPLRPELVPAVARCLGAAETAVRDAARTAFGAEPSPQPEPLPVASDGPSTLPAAGQGRLDSRLPADPFIGRTAQLGELRLLLGSTRALTLSGLAGVGKTRLAMELGRQVAADYEDGVWLVELAATRDPGLLPSALAAALGIREQGSRPLVETLCSRLRESRRLVLMDNCEHLVEACAALLGELIGSCPQVTFMATSQGPLGVEGERLWVVAPLDVPAPDATPEAARESEAVMLFCRAAAASRPGFSLSADLVPAVAQICRGLEGLPLAIKLAAARVSILTPVEIAGRLGQPAPLLGGGSGPSRHRSLQAALAWTYDLLTPAEGRLLRGLSVFAGGCGIEAVEAVCAPAGDMEILDSLGALVAKSLVTADASGERARYRLLETVREYAGERAAEVGEMDALRHRHLRWCIVLAEAGDEGLTSSDQMAWSARLDLEHDNLRTALSWAIATGDADAALRLAGSLALFWRSRGYFRAGRTFLESAISLDASATSAHLGKALRGKGFLALMALDTEAAIPALEQALELSRAQGDLRGEARSLLLLGNTLALTVTGLRDPRPLFDASIDLARQAGDQWCLGHALALQAHQLSRAGGDAARLLLEECVRGARDAGELQSLRIGLYLLGRLEFGSGHHGTAEALISEGLEVTRRLGEPFDSAAALEFLGELALARGDQVTARTHLVEALALARHSGEPGAVCRTLAALGAERLQSSELVEAQALFEQSAATASAGRVPSPPSTELGLGEIAALRGDMSAARRFFERGLALATDQKDLAARGRAIGCLAELSRSEGRLRRSAAQHRQALGVRSEIPDFPGIAESLDGLAGVAAADRRWEEAARLLGAVRSLSHRGVSVPPRHAWQAPAASLPELSAELGPRRCARALEHGAAMSIQEAVALALGGVSSQGPARMGWQGLTKAEHGVAGLVAEGLTNAQIAERLFVTKSTVEWHLSSIFGKLGLESRAQLIRESLQRGAAG